MPKKLIEVALPLEAINAESAREKSIRHGHPSTLHLWWARRPLAAARAVIWSSLVDDPSEHSEQFPTEEEQNKERQRLFAILEELVKWENSNDPEILDAAKAEILRSTGNNPPPLLDPFAGGGAIPLEAQRLGLEAHAHDLNPVAVMINKAMIEIPPKFAGQAPVNPDARARLDAADGWTGAKGLAEDVRYYGEWMKQQAFKKIGHLYPKVKVPAAQGGGEATVIAGSGLGPSNAPTPPVDVRCRWPPLCSRKKGKEAWWSRFRKRKKSIPYITRENLQLRARGAKACLCGETLWISIFVRKVQKNVPLMAVVAEGNKGCILSR